MYLGPTIAASHSLVPARMRSMTSAILLFVLNIIGLGLGPLLIGMLSGDYVSFSLQAILQSMYTFAKPRNVNNPRYLTGFSALASAAKSPARKACCCSTMPG